MMRLFWTRVYDILILNAQNTDMTSLFFLKEIC